MFAPDDQNRFTVILAGQTAHGMMHRYLSNARLPAWVSAGLSVWVGEQLVSSDKSFEQYQQRSAEVVTRERTLGELFKSDPVRNVHFGCAVTLIDRLIRIDAQRFGNFVRDMKLGYDQSEALFRNYEMTRVDLAREYGRSIGVANLRP